MSTSNEGGTRPDTAMSNPSPITTTSAHDTSNRGGRGRGRGRGRGNSYRGRGGICPRETQRFQGREEGLQGHIYDLQAHKSPDQYIRTTHEITNYIGRIHKKHTAIFVKAIEALELDMPLEPDDPDETSAVAMERWKVKFKKYNEETDAYNDFLAHLYNLVMGQCTVGLEEHIKSHADYESASQNGIALLRIIKQLTYSFEDRRKLADALCEVKEGYYRMRQGEHETLQDYHERFKNHMAMMEEIGASFADTIHIGEIALKNGRTTANSNDVDMATKEAIAVRFMQGSNKHHQAFLQELHNQYLNKQDWYPSTLSKAYNVMLRRTGDRVQYIPTSDGLTFTTAGTTRTTTEHDCGTTLATQGENSHATNNIIAGTDGRIHENVKCYGCNNYGHYQSHCPQTTDTRQSAQTHLTMGFSFMQSTTKKQQTVPHTWVLLDNQSTADVFCNSQLLINIRKAATSLDIHCNSGSTTTDMEGDLPGYGTVWYHPSGIANILSLGRVRKRYRITFDSEVGNRFLVTKPDGTTFEFKESPTGLYYMDAEAQVQKQAQVHVNTVADNKSSYSNTDYLRALAARKLQIKIGNPTAREFIKIASRNLLPNCPITRDDIQAAEDIFGPDVGGLKGKTVRRPPHRVETHLEAVPRGILKRYQKVTVCADIMFVNSIPFMVSISRNIRFGTVEPLTGTKAELLLRAIKNIRNTYAQGGFKVDWMLMDGQFENLRGDIANLGIRLNEVAEDEHVGEIERYIRTVKERCRSACTVLPFKRLPARMVIELVRRAVFWLNAFPHQNGVSDTMSPRTIITGRHVDYNKHCKYEFGQYVQVHDQHDNTMLP